MVWFVPEPGIEEFVIAKARQALLNGSGPGFVHADVDYAGRLLFRVGPRPSSQECPRKAAAELCSILAEQPVDPSPAQRI